MRAGWPFVPTEALGAGTTATVFKVIHRETDQPYVVKMLKKEANLSPLLREADVLEQISKYPACVPHLACYYGGVALPREEGGYDYALVLDYVPGSDFATVIADVRASHHGEGQMPLRTAFTAIEGMLAGLSAVHERGTAHRDVKPRNLILSPTGRHFWWTLVWHASTK